MPETLNEAMIAIEKRALELYGNQAPANVNFSKLAAEAPTPHALALLCLTYNLPIPSVILDVDKNTARMAFNAGARFNVG